MEESVTYQAILRKGATQELQKVLLQVAQKRLGSADAATRTALQAITDVERLERLIGRAFEVASWAELLATP